MDKIFSSHNNNYIKNKKGFALMITLSVLAVVIALTMVLLSYFEKVQQDASHTKALIQANIYYSDILNIFNRFEKKETLFSTLYKFPIPLSSPKDNFSLILDCKPLSEGVNINWLALENTPNKKDVYTISQTVFDTLVQQYSIENPERLQEMILLEIGEEKKFVKKEYSRLRQKNGIISYKQFTSILSQYQMEVDDLEIYLVPWKKYFSFSPSAKVIDAQYSSPELISLLFDIDLQTVEQWHANFEKSNLEVFIQGNGGDYASRKKLLADKKFLEESECTVSYISTGEKYKFNFKYIQGKGTNFEFYEKQQ